MKRAFVGLLINLVLCAGLAAGGNFADFSFYVMLAFNVLAWAGLLLGGVTKDVAVKLRPGLWVAAVSSGLGIAALVFYGHPVLAASAAVCALLVAVRILEVSRK